MYKVEFTPLFKEKMKNIKLCIAYDGTSFFGWQKSKEGPTIEGALQATLKQILQEKVELRVASRTDRGVHAERQIANFTTQKQTIDLKRLKKSLNQMLPLEIRIWKVEEVDENFHSSIDAIGKEYHYFLTTTPLQLPFKRHFAWHFPHPLSFDAMQKAAPFFLGTHDFKALYNANEPRPTDMICTLHRLDIFQSEHDVRFEIFGNHFLYKMVRNIAGTLVYIGAGKIPAEEAPLLLKQRDRTRTGITAPAHGLLLKKIYHK